MPADENRARDREIMSVQFKGFMSASLPRILKTSDKKVINNVGRSGPENNKKVVELLSTQANPR